MIRLLCVVGSMNAGGAQSFLMKIYRNMNRDLYQMDFCVNIKDKGYYDDEIYSLGGKIHYIPSKSDNFALFSIGLFRLIKNNHYKHVLRITSNGIGFYDLFIAKMAGATRCVARSTNSSDGANWLFCVANRLGQLLFNKYIDLRIAPSELAAIYTFGKREAERQNVVILHNAVNYNQYCFNNKSRNHIRHSLGLEDNCVVVGHIGRFVEQKNHTFLIKVFQYICNINNDAVLLLIGEGENYQAIKDLVDKIGLTEKVYFLGVRRDIPDLMSAMDIMVFPSLYEGMPNVVIEAQANGLPAILSDTITQEADFTGLIRYLSLKETPEKWARQSLNMISNIRVSTKKAFKDNHYLIEDVVKDFENLVFNNTLP